MAPRKGVVITEAILIVITAASFIVWYIPQNSQTAFNVTDFEGHLDATKAIHRTLDASLKEDFEMVVSGSLDPAEYVGMAETATSQSSAQITGLISSSPAEKWVASYAAYADSLRNFNSYIRETIVYAKLVQELQGGSESGALQHHKEGGQSEISLLRANGVLGECINARKWENVKTEIYGKVWLYNHLIDTAIDNGYGTPRVVCPSVKPAPKQL